MSFFFCHFLLKRKSLYHYGYQSKSVIYERVGLVSSGQFHWTVEIRTRV